MTVQAESEPLAHAPGISIDALAALARAVNDAATRQSLAPALQDVVAAARASTGADVALVRVRTGDLLETVAVAGSAALAAELEGDRVPASELPAGRVDLLSDAGAGVLRVAGRVHAGSVLVLPVRLDGGAATLELYRAGPFSPSEELAAELAAGHAALVLRAFAVPA